MHRFARDCQAIATECLPIERPFSNFDFVDQRFSDVWPLRRTFSQVRAHGGKTMVVESLDPGDAADLAEENEDIAKRFGADVTSEVWRLSFFWENLSTSGDLGSVATEHFLGYAIVKRDKVAGGDTMARIYESVMVPSRRENNFVRGAQRWQCRVGDRIMEATGYLYAQQNVWTNACAHVACRTAAARFHQNGDMTYREMNELLPVQIDHVSRKAEGGLACGEMRAILEAAGARCIVADYTTTTAGFSPPPFQKYVYGSVESGYPAIVFFRTEDDDYHAIPVFGHTFNEDMWVPNAEFSYFRVGAGTVYVPSEQWLSTFIAHDDNWGSNYCIPRHFLYTKRHCEKWPGGAKPCEVQSDCVSYVIATLPKDVEVNPIDAEVIGADYLFRMLPELPELSPPWGQRLEQYAKRQQLVLRPILVDGAMYAAHLSKLRDWSDGRVHEPLVELLRGLSLGKLWLVELSVPELFSANLRKLGEVILLADRPPGKKRDFRNFLLARVPGHFAFRTGGDAINPEFKFVPSGVAGHVALYGCEGCLTS